MNIDEIKKRYENEPKFYALVNLFYGLMYENPMPFSEMNAALTFAAIKFENEHVRPISFGMPR